MEEVNYIISLVVHNGDLYYAHTTHVCIETQTETDLFKFEKACDRSAIRHFVYA